MGLFFHFQLEEYGFSSYIIDLQLFPQKVTVMTIPKLFFIGIVTHLYHQAADCAYYEFSNQQLTWTQANDFCQSSKMALLYFDPDYRAHLTKWWSEENFPAQGFDTVYFWSVHKVLESSVEYGKRYYDDFPIDNYKSGNHLCIRAVFEALKNITNWEAVGCNYEVEYFFCVTTDMLPGETHIVYEANVKWETAKDFCIEQSGYLLTSSKIEIEYDNLFEFGPLSTVSSKSFWIGFKRMETVNQNMYLPFFNLYSETTNSDICVYIVFTFGGLQWSTDSCANGRHGFICESYSTSDPYFFHMPSILFIGLIELTTIQDTPENCKRKCELHREEGVFCAGFNYLLSQEECTTLVSYDSPDNNSIYQITAEYSAAYDAYTIFFANIFFGVYTTEGTTLLDVKVPGTPTKEEKSDDKTTPMDNTTPVDKTTFLDATTQKDKIKPVDKSMPMDNTSPVDKTTHMGNTTPIDKNTPVTKEETKFTSKRQENQETTESQNGETAVSALSVLGGVAGLASVAVMMKGFKKQRNSSRVNIGVIKKTGMIVKNLFSLKTQVECQQYRNSAPVVVKGPSM